MGGFLKRNVQEAIVVEGVTLKKISVKGKIVDAFSTLSPFKLQARFLKNSQLVALAEKVEILEETKRDAINTKRH